MSPRRSKGSAAMVRSNVLANILGRIWAMAIVYVFAPVYLSFLGHEVYGLVGFYSTLLGVVAFTDVGLTMTLSREMARLSAIDVDGCRRRNLLRTYELVYFGISVLIAVLVYSFAPSIVKGWLKIINLTQPEAIEAIRWMGVAIALQMPAGLFIGGLMGLQRQVSANVLQIGWGTVRAFGAVMTLRFIANDIVSFSISQVFANLFYCLGARMLLWASLGRANTTPRFDLGVLAQTWKYASGMALSTMLSIVISQADKLIISRSQSLASFGYYSLAATLAAIPMSLANPVGNAFFPHLTALYSSGKTEDLKVAYHRGSFFVSLMTIPVVSVAGCFARPLLFAWTGSAEVAESARLAAVFLIIGQGLQAITILPYFTLLAFGKIRLNIGLSLFSIITVTPILLILTGKFGLTGAGLSWLIMNLLTLPPYMFYMHRITLTDELNPWLLKDVLLPTIAALPVVLLSRIFLPIPTGRIATFVYLGFLWALSSACIVLTSPKSRARLVDLFRRQGWAVNR